MKKRILNWTKPAFICLLCAVMLCEIGLTAFAESEGEVMLSNLAGQSGAYELNPITGEFEATMHPEFFDMEPEDVPPSGIFPEEIEPRSESAVVDDREPVYYPSGTSGTTCRIAGRYGSGTYDLNKGTGWLLNKQFLLTSAHVVYRYGVGPCSHVGIYVGASGENHYKEYRLGHVVAYSKTFEEAKNMVSYDDFKNWHEETGIFEDWAVVKLDKPVSLDYVYLGREAANGFSDVKGHTYYTQGYPQDLTSDVTYWPNAVMYKSSGTFTGPFTRQKVPVVKSTFYASHGQSGSPIYWFNANKKGWYADGILAGGYDGATCVVLINSWLLSEINYILRSNL